MPCDPLTPEQREVGELVDAIAVRAGCRNRSLRGLMLDTHETRCSEQTDELERLGRARELLGAQHSALSGAPR